MFSVELENCRKYLGRSVKQPYLSANREGFLDELNFGDGPGKIR